jgi:protein involved in polysaccharide export with SLBB domain
LIDLALPRLMLGLLVCAALANGGCWANSFFDPSEMGAYPKGPLLVPILDQLDTGYEEGDERFATATNVRPEDLQVVPSDYVISPNDLLQISIEGLQAPGVESFRQVRVSETGNISLPYIGQLKAAGLTEAQLQDAIVRAYQDQNLLQQASVAVNLLEARGRTFTITGNVALAGQYAIYESDFRLLDALALARGVTTQGIEHVYIIRRRDQDPAAMERAPDVDEGPATRPADVLTPQSRANPPVTPGTSRRVAMLKTEAQDATANQPAPGETPPPTAPAGEREGRIIIIDGKEVRVDGTEPMPAEQQPGEPAPIEDAELMPDAATQPFEFDELQEPTNTRTIRIPYDRLQRGELRYNVVIRPKDMIIVPDPLIGEYYMGGHVQRTGVYSLTARDITLTQAIISAGMLDQLAVPWRTEIRRRIGDDREIVAMVDLSKIFAGKEPNIYLKPYDQVMVGTEFWAPFLAAARNGFRITYGFGFLYDRNYYDDDEFN